MLRLLKFHFYNLLRIISLWIAAILECTYNSMSKLSPGVEGANKTQKLFDVTATAKRAERVSHAHRLKCNKVQQSALSNCIQWTVPVWPLSRPIVSLINFLLYIFIYLLILDVKPRTLRKSELNHYTSQETHGEKTMKKVSVLDVGGKPQRIIPYLQFHVKIITGCGGCKQDSKAV